ncbi:MAG: 4-hydroxythreonine-4-phosphate dehydrogenase PdxA [Bacteroidales bacterium]|nr:4-hydroxythreonine-4-phosphate dehydrogenase PdxA [Bacteroidales bacterium]MCF8405382.1 4-hydroxythreonine-4-phosphate dehydrogenase PdxA [Bacteroidales bacterium]
MKHDKIILGISHGDINSISYEVIIKALMDPRILDICIPVVYGSPKVASYHRTALNIENFSLNTINSIDELSIKKPGIINCVDENIRVELGKSSQVAGQAAKAALELAVNDLKEGKIDALVTGPINKHNIQSSDFQFSGHTEYLQYIFQAEEVLMLMVSDILRVGVVTGHVPLSNVHQLLSEEIILDKLRLLNTSLKVDFGIRKPTIAVLGFNPHAGENGLLGTEETEIIIPAIQKANEENILAFGPYATDGFFGSGSFKKFDATLAMYHDQGLTPFKTLVSETGVNYTAGLPMVRTSPAHGTAYALAGKNEASHLSFLNAMYTACDIFKNRKSYQELAKNPLPPGIPKEVQGTRDQPGE